MDNQLVEINQESLSEGAAIMAIIAKAASDPNTDVVKLEKLLDMQERILNRNSRMAYSSALASMQADLPEIEKNGKLVVTKGGQTTPYALFEDINEAVKPVLKNHGFAISFRIKQDAAWVEVTAVLNHREGHAEETSIRLPQDSSGSKNNVQAVGSSVSYGKRYTMCALLNITSRGDDDNASSATGYIDTEKAVEIDLFITKVKANKPKFLQAIGVDDVRHIRANEYGKAIAMLQAKEKQVQAKGQVA